MSTPLPLAPCIHCGPFPGSEDTFTCRIGHKKDPTRRYCQDYCEKRIRPGTYAEAKRQEFKTVRDRGGYTVNSPGLGDVVAWIIVILTLGQGHRIAKTIAKLRGKKNCGCKKRREALNRVGKAKTEYDPQS